MMLETNKYKTLNGWNKKSIVDHFKLNFKGKAFRSLVSGVNNCAYRGDEGTKCAVGLFIPDELYSPTMEGHLYNDLIRRFSVEHLMPLSRHGMESLQRVHDSSFTLTTFDQILGWIEENVED